MHDVIALSDDPIVLQRLRAAQELQPQDRSDSLLTLVSGPDPSACDAEVEWSEEFGYGGRAKRRRTQAHNPDLLNAEEQNWSLNHVVRSRNAVTPRVDLLDADDDDWTLSEAAKLLQPRTLHPQQPPHPLGGQRSPPLQVHIAHSARTT